MHAQKCTHTQHAHAPSVRPPLGPPLHAHSIVAPAPLCRSASQTWRSAPMPARMCVRTRAHLQGGCVAHTRKNSSSPSAGVRDEQTCDRGEQTTHGSSDGGRSWYCAHTPLLQGPCVPITTGDVGSCQRVHDDAGHTFVGCPGRCSFGWVLLWCMRFTRGPSRVETIKSTRMGAHLDRRQDLDVALKDLARPVHLFVAELKLRSAKYATGAAMRAGANTRVHIYCHTHNPGTSA